MVPDLVFVKYDLILTSEFFHDRPMNGLKDSGLGGSYGMKAKCIRFMREMGIRKFRSNI
jgi:hypothetical protein